MKTWLKRIEWNKVKYLVTGKIDEIEEWDEELAIEFLNNRPSPQEFIFMALNGLSKIEEIQTIDKDVPNVIIKT